MRRMGWINVCIVEEKETYGAVVVSSKMCLFLRSCASGRCCRCFSKLLRRSLLRTGEMGVSSTTTALFSFSEAMMDELVQVLCE